MQVDPRTTAVVLVEYQNDFTTEGGTLHGAVEGVMKQNDMLENSQRRRRVGPPRGRDHPPRADHLRAGLRRAGRSRQGVRHPQGRDRLELVRQGHLGRRDLRPDGAAGGRHRRRGQARAGHLRDHQHRLHPAQPRDRDGRAGRVPHQLLRRVDDAHGVREGLRRDHADRLHRRDQRRGAAGGRDQGLSDVLEADDRWRVHARCSRAPPSPAISPRSARSCPPGRPRWSAG